MILASSQVVFDISSLSHLVSENAVEGKTSLKQTLVSDLLVLLGATLSELGADSLGEFL